MCTVDDVNQQLQEQGVQLSFAAISVLDSKGSEINMDDVGKVLPTSEKIVQFKGGEFAEHFMELAMEDYLDEEGVPTVPASFLENLEETINSITDFYDKVDDEQKVRIKTYDSNSQTKGVFSPSTDKDIDDIAVLNNPMYKMASQTEVVLHESIHSIAKGAFNLDHKLRQRVLNMKEILDKFSHDANVFLRFVANPTEQDIKDAQAKYDYVLGEFSEAEEFVAYYVSNPSFQEHVDAMIHDSQKDDSVKKKSPFPKKPNVRFRKDPDAPKYKNVFNKVISELDKADVTLNLKKAQDKAEIQDPNTSTVSILVDDIINFKAKMYVLAEDKVVGNTLNLDDSFLGALLPSVIKSPVKAAGEFVDTVRHKHNSSKSVKRLKKRLGKHFSILKDYT
ncbi:MAG: hypothetical protein KAG66_14265, partial [Methylococcales bacterium]|nr:hypothetical protein [Methylococcales bacterium]